MSLMRRLLREQQGAATLTELLVTIAFLISLAFATFALHDSGQTAAAAISDRAEAIRVGSSAIERITRDLRQASTVYQVTPTAINVGTQYRGASASASEQLILWDCNVDAPSGEPACGRFIGVAPSQEVQYVAQGRASNPPVFTVQGDTIYVTLTIAVPNRRDVVLRDGVRIENNA